MSSAVPPALVDPALAEIEARWPTFRVPWPEVLSALGGGTGGAEAARPDHPHLADMYLVCGCLRRDPEALRTFDEHWLRASVAVVARLDPSPDFQSEVCQLLRERLLVGGGAQPARLGQYRGEGPLRGWLAVAAQRLALDLLRQRGGRTQPRREEALAHHLASAPAADLALVKARHKQDFEQALRAGLGALSSRDRLLLNLSIVEGFSLQRIGKMYGVDQSTVSRWLARARDQILETIRAELAARLGLDHRELESLVGLVGSQVDISLAGLLRADSNK